MCSHEIKREIINLGCEGIELLKKYDLIIEREKQVVAEKLRIEKCLKNLMEGCEEGFADGRRVRWEVVETGKFDLELLKANEPELYEQYCHTEVSRRLRISNAE